MWPSFEAADCASKRSPGTTSKIGQSCANPYDVYSPARKIAPIVISITGPVNERIRHLAHRHCVFFVSVIAES